MKISNSAPAILLLGAGLSNCLIALELLKSGFSSFTLVDGSDRIGGDHTWSFFDSDLNAKFERALEGLPRHRWSKYEVQFPNYFRQLENGYNSIRSSELHSYLLGKLKPGQLRLSATVDQVLPNNVILKSGERLNADIIIDGRGIPQNELGPCGFQNFLGQDIFLKNPHGLQWPILMDANVEQKDGYRFMYVLPLDAKTLLVEDTRFSKTPSLDKADFQREIATYVQQKYGPVETVVREEAASLALPLTDRMFQHFQAEPMLTVGSRGGWIQPVTGYTFPLAIEVATTVCQAIENGGNVALQLQILHRQWRKKCRFYFILNLMMFGAAEDASRRKIFEHFYRRSPGFIDGFYSSRLSQIRALSLFWGRPPVAVTKAIKCLWDRTWVEKMNSI